MSVGKEYVRAVENKSAFSADELFEARRSLLSTLKKCEKVLESDKLPQSQRTLTERRVDALKIALALIERELANAG
jgi:predicted DNA binding protein